MIPDEDFHNSPEMRAFSRRINQTISSGVDVSKGRTLDSWRSDPIKKHLRHGCVHMLNVMHHENMELPDKDSEGRQRGNQFNNAITRLFFAATIHDVTQREAMRGMQEEIAE